MLKICLLLCSDYLAWLSGRPGIFGSYSIPPLIIVRDIESLREKVKYHISMQTTTMFCLTIYKCGRALRAYRPSMMPIITLFLRDGVFWFLAVFGGLLLQANVVYVF